MALMVILLGTSFNAEAQLGGLAIPKPEPNGQPVSFTLGDKEICTWNPATLELTFSADGDVYKMDANTGKFANSKGESKGSINADGTITSPFFGEMGTTLYKDGDLYVMKNGDINVGKIEKFTNCYTFHGANFKKQLEGQSSAEVDPFVIAYVYFALSNVETEIDKTTEQISLSASSLSSSSSSSTSSSTDDKAKRVKVYKNGNHVGYVDGNGNVYDDRGDKIGHLPDYGYIEDARGYYIGSIRGGTIEASSKTVCKVSGLSIEIVDPEQNCWNCYVKAATISLDREVIRYDWKRGYSSDKIGYTEIDIKNYEWLAALVFCDFFF